MKEVEPMAQKQYFRNYAFISYSRKDETWAKWLQTWLESYRLPASIRKQRLDLPQRIRPVFRDKTDLSGGYLEDQLLEELDASRNLILICSPNSAKSDWVNKEVEYFISLGRAEDIIPFIVEGTPNSGDPATECFPPALRNMEKELLGIDVQALGRIDAVLAVISSLLDVRNDQIVMRYRRRRMKQYLLAAAMTLVAAIGLGTGIWWNTPHSKYYRNYITRFEIPEGIGELTEREREGSYESYRITTLRGKVISLERVNSAGTPVDCMLNNAMEDAPVLEYTYDGSGRLVAIQRYDTTRQLQSSIGLTYGADGLTIALDYRTADNLHGQALSADLSYGTYDSGSGYSRIIRQFNTYSEDGLLQTSMFHGDAFGTPACDSTGIYGKRYTYTDRGQVHRVDSLDDQGQVYNCRNGWATVEYTYLENGQVHSEKFLDAAGNPAVDSHGTFLYVLTYDAIGNAIYHEAYDITGQPSKGVFRQEVGYDHRGYPIYTCYRDQQGELIMDGDGVYITRVECDDQGRFVEVWYQDAQGNLIFSPNYGCAGVRLVLDERGRMTQTWYYGVDGQLSNEIGHYCGVGVTYDAWGYVESQRYYGSNRELTMTNYGYAICVRQNDENGRLLHEAYFDTQGQPVTGVWGAACSYSYDEVGNMTGFAYHDMDLNFYVAGNGYAVKEMEYEDGRLVMERYFDENMMPTLLNGEYFCVRYEYDAAGNRIRETYLGIDEEPICIANGYSILETDYDAYGSRIRTEYYESPGVPMDAENPRTENAFEYAYDVRGNVSLRKFIHVDASGRETCLYQERMFYDPMGNMTWGERLDGNGNPTVTNDGSARIYFTYDYLGNVVRQTRYGLGGDPVTGEGFLNRVEFVYDENGNRIDVEQYSTMDLLNTLRIGVQTQLGN